MLIKTELKTNLRNYRARARIHAWIHGAILFESFIASSEKDYWHGRKSRCIESP
jgi:hypothetical protein